MIDPTPQNEVLPSPSSMSPMTPAPSSGHPIGKWFVVGAILILLILGTIKLWSRRNQDIPTIALQDKVTVVDLMGFDQPQILNGSCFESYLFNSVGVGADGTQKYALSVTLKNSPKDQVALAQLLESESCTAELKTMTDAIKVKFPDLASFSATEQFSTSFKTKSGQRLFLP